MELYHYGIKGMRWGVRRFQNKDGTLTPKGKKRYQGSRGDVEKKFKVESRDGWNRLARSIDSASGDLHDIRDGSHGFMSKRLSNALKWEKNKLKKFNQQQDALRPKSIIKVDDADKAYWDIVGKPGVTEKERKKAYNKYVSVVFNPFTGGRTKEALEYRKKHLAAHNELMNEFNQRIASVYLRDMGYNDTQTGRDFLIRNGFVDEEEY